MKEKEKGTTMSQAQLVKVPETITAEVVESKTPEKKVTIKCGNHTKKILRFAKFTNQEVPVPFLNRDETWLMWGRVRVFLLETNRTKGLQERMWITYDVHCRRDENEVLTSVRIRPPQVFSPANTHPEDYTPGGRNEETGQYDQGDSWLAASDSREDRKKFRALFVQAIKDIETGKAAPQPWSEFNKRTNQYPIMDFVELEQPQQWASESDF